ncbi:MAG: nucleotidyltransferase domain-containing protein [Armatimonadetes bacterium]|nr:nucleotidyltransferase domain-containing protein [Armatimonadota bacterium]
MRTEKKIGEGKINWQDFRQVRQLLLKEKAYREKQLRARALEKAQAVADWLKSRYNVKEVYLYGSLAWGKFTPQSDIDLLIVGFPNHARFWDMQVKAEEMATPFPVSIVCAEDAVESLRKRVFREGIRIAWS